MFLTLPDRIHFYFKRCFHTENLKIPARVQLPDPSEVTAPELKKQRQVPETINLPCWYRYEAEEGAATAL
jgi:hypothetical protein